MLDRRHVRTARLVLGLLAVASPTAHAQSRDTVRLGDRVRLDAVGDVRPIIGRLDARAGDTLMLTRGGGTRLVLGRSVNQVERSLGRSSARTARHDALVGAAIGGTIMALGGASGLKGVEVVGAVGTWGALGGLVGAVRRPERWRTAVLGPPALGTVAVAAAPVAADSAAAGAARSLRHTLLALSPRDLVRFSVGDPPERVTGIVIAATPDTLLIERGGLATRYPMAGVVDLQRFAGRTARSGAVHGGLVGGTVGAILGGLFGLALSNVCFDTCNPHRSVAGGVVAGGVLFGGIGVGIGAAVGQARPREDWRAVEVGASQR